MRIVIDPGHGGAETGAVYRGLEEKYINLEVGRLLLPRLEDMRVFEYKYTRLDDEFISLRERCRIANDFNADFFLSIHCNADPDPDLPNMPEAKGEEIWYYDGSSKGCLYASVIADLIDRIFIDEKFRGIKPTKNFTVLKHTNMPANLIELGFIDNSETWRHLKNIVVLSEISNVLALCLGRIYRLWYKNNEHA